MEVSAKIVSAFQSLIIFAKYSILDIWKSSEYTYDLLVLPQHPWRRRALFIKKTYDQIVSIKKFIQLFFAREILFVEKQFFFPTKLK